MKRPALFISGARICSWHSRTREVKHSSTQEEATSPNGAKIRAGLGCFFASAECSIGFQPVPTDRSMSHALVYRRPLSDGFQGVSSITSGLSRHFPQKERKRI